MQSPPIILMSIGMLVLAACSRTDEDISLAEYSKSCPDYKQACNCQYVHLKKTLNKAEFKAVVESLNELQTYRESGVAEAEAQPFPGSEMLRNIYFDAVLACIQD